jgi:hypothetical protein
MASKSSNDRAASPNSRNTAATVAPSPANPAVSKVPDVDACSLLSRDEAGQIFGEIKEGPKADTGLQKEKECRYSNMSGAILTISLYGADRWDMQKNLVNDKNPQSIAGLGDEAFAVHRGTDSEVYVRKGGAILEVRTSGGMEVARRIAEKAVSRL